MSRNDPPIADPGADIAKVAERMFGHPVDAEILQAAEARLAVVPRNLSVLQAWQGRLGMIDPAPVFRLPFGPRASGRKR